jgi:hypothetical protein
MAELIGIGGVIRDSGMAEVAGNKKICNVLPTRLHWSEHVTVFPCTTCGTHKPNRIREIWFCCAGP